jgi:hypothetical protein
MAQIFVAVLGASSFTFAKATWTQTLPDWIDAHVRAFETIGGLPELVVPDNTKTAIVKASFYDPQAIDNDRNAVTGVIDEQALAGGVRLAHRHRQRLLEGQIELAEPRVAVAAGIGGDIFVPQDQERDVLAASVRDTRRPNPARRSSGGRTNPSAE